MVPFGGWDMPVQYTGILDEARAVRSNAGIFDVSHMGRIEISGPNAVSLLNRVLSIDVSSLRRRRARYGFICNVEGGIIDDTIVYRLGRERYLLVPERLQRRLRCRLAAPMAKGFGRGRNRHRHRRARDDRAPGDRPAQLALSGLTDYDLPSLRLFRAAETEVADAPSIVAHTGYTGEDGFELMVPAGDAARIWRALSGRRRRAMRPGRAGRAAPGGGAATSRQRHRRGHQPIRGRAGQVRPSRPGRVRRQRGP